MVVYFALTVVSPEQLKIDTVEPPSVVTFRVKYMQKQDVQISGSPRSALWSHCREAHCIVPELMAPPTHRMYLYVNPHSDKLLPLAPPTRRMYVPVCKIP